MKGYQFGNGVDLKKLSWTEDLPDIKLELSSKHFLEFYKTMLERQEIWHKRFILKEDRPWTDDEFFSNNKFTNVYRELDRASQWLIKNVLTDHSLSIEDLLWKNIIFRFFNQPDTFVKGGVELTKWSDFNAKEMWSQVVTWREKGNNPWHIAYMMNMAFLPKPKDWEGRGLFKDFAYVQHVFSIIHKKIPELTKIIRSAKEPEDIIKFLETFPATSGFQSHEFYIDFCYAAKYWKKPIMKFDQNDYTNVGPGASLGLRLIFPSLKPNEQIQGIYILRDYADKGLSTAGKFKYLQWDKNKQEYYVNFKKSNITLHQIEMWLCEYSKYWKMSIGKGKQRSKFKPSKNQIMNA